MFSFFKNIFNAIILVLVFVGLNTLYNAHVFDGIIDSCSEFLKQKSEQTVQKVGDFSRINQEFSVDTAVNLFGYKAVLAEHKASGQRMIVLDSGKKVLLSREDIKGNGIKEKLDDLSNKFKYKSSNVSDIEIVIRGNIYAYGKNLPYVRFNARVTRLPINRVSGIIAINDSNPKEQRILISINEKGRYSQLITNEFYKAVRESN